MMKLIRKKRKLWKQFKSNDLLGVFLKFKELRKKTKRLINTSYYNHLQSLSGKLQDNPKYFWSFYSVKSKTKRIPDTIIYDNVCSTDTSRWNLCEGILSVPLSYLFNLSLRSGVMPSCGNPLTSLLYIRTIRRNLWKITDQFPCSLFQQNVLIVLCILLFMHIFCLIYLSGSMDS